jgi:hypothetical protein
MMAKNLYLLILAVCIVSIGSVYAAEPLGVDLSFDFNSKYIWRGQNLDDDYAFQPGATLTYGNLSAGIWGSMELTDYTGNKGEFTEVDYSLDYSSTLGSSEVLGYSLGLIYYDFPNTAIPSTTEVYWGFSLDVPLAPSVTVYHDVDEAEGIYASFGISHSIEKIGIVGDVPVGMDIGVAVGWGDSDYNTYYWSIDDDCFNDLSVSVAFPMEIGGWTFSPSINYVTLLDSDLRESDVYAGGSDYFFTGISLSKSF